jgi:FkbM family methyltransferase
MAFEFSRRRAKQLMTPLIPERWKAPLRGRLFGYRASETVLPVAFRQDGESPMVTIDAKITLRFRERDQSDMRYQFVENGSAIEEISSFIGLAESSQVLFDVGASKGVFSQIFCLVQPRGHAVSFEPSPLAMADATVLAQLNGCESQITMRQTAVGRAPGRAFGSVAPDGFAVLGPSPEATESFEVTSVDDEVLALGMTPDLLKIDVEGHEYEVLLGARNLLRQRKPVVCLELHLDELERRGVDARDVLGELQSHGYRFRKCSGADWPAAAIRDSISAIVRLVAT